MEDKIMKKKALDALAEIIGENQKKCEKNICSTSEKEYIDRRMAAVEDVMKSQSGKDFRKNVLETVGKLKEDYPCCADYIDNLYNGFVQKYNIDFFEEIK